MKTFLMTISMVTFLSSAVFAMSVDGTYKTSEGDMTLKQSGDRISGRYATDNGEITGVLYDTTLDGFWIEDHSDRRCPSPKNGRYYWGRVSWEFNDNGFSGTWGYCNDSPARQWTGTRTGGGRASYGSDSDGFAEESHSIEGTWGSSEGDITFRQNGSKVSGRYSQDNGEIIGRIKGSDLDGYWIEDHSDKRCGSQKNGRYFWGKIQWRFDGDRFSGKWGYCEDSPSRQWTGQRK